MIECALVGGFMLLRRAKSVRSCSRQDPYH